MIIKIITTVNHLCVWELSSKSTAQKHTRDGPAEFDLSLTAAWGAKMLAGTGPTPQMKDTEQFQFLPKVKNVITTFTTVSIPAFTPLSHRYVLKEHPAGDKKKKRASQQDTDGMPLSGGCAAFKPFAWASIDFSSPGRESLLTCHQLIRSICLHISMRQTM